MPKAIFKLKKYFMFCKVSISSKEEVDKRMFSKTAEEIN